ncbi:MAG: penicillin acylase family protein, partial [Thermoleophilaceae bacterium]|nr:penicillin acylase family protein [Thermoleophilaceae bacterium]
MATTALVLLGALVLAVPANAQEAPFRQNDFGGFRNILPPGQAGHLSAPALAQYLANGTRPRNSSDQLRMYQDLVYSTPGLQASQIGRFFKDASFGVRPGDVTRRYKPRQDVTILRDRQFGVPHIYGTTRAGAMYGLGYAGAEDRLFFMDVLRNAGAGRLSSFAGGAAGNREMDRDSWDAAPYKPEEYQRQIDVADEVLGALGRKLQKDARSYVAGINSYIADARSNPSLMPAEYAAINRPGGPKDWKTGDLVATAALIAGIFGKGGGNELASAQLLQQARTRFGRRGGTKVWRDLRTAEEPTAPTTVFRDRVFRYQRPPK